MWFQIFVRPNLNHWTIASSLPTLFGFWGWVIADNASALAFFQLWNIVFAEPQKLLCN